MQERFLILMLDIDLVSLIFDIRIYNHDSDIDISI